jgi:hypothetical protein
MYFPGTTKNALDASALQLPNYITRQDGSS